MTAAVCVALPALISRWAAWMNPASRALTVWSEVLALVTIVCDWVGVTGAGIP